MITTVEMICLVIKGDKKAFLVPLAESTVAAARCKIVVSARSSFMSRMNRPILWLIPRLPYFFCD